MWNKNSYIGYENSYNKYKNQSFGKFLFDVLKF